MPDKETGQFIYFLHLASTRQWKLHQTRPIVVCPQQEILKVHVDTYKFVTSGRHACVCVHVHVSPWYVQTDVAIVHVHAETCILANLIERACHVSRTSHLKNTFFLKI